MSSIIPANVRSFIDAYEGQTPHLVVSLDVVKAKYSSLVKAMPKARHHYAMKANPDPDLLKMLSGLGCYFECASIQEIDLCITAGAAAKDILYGNPLKKVSEIRAAYERGIEQYVFDAEMELEKIIEHAPGSKVLCRIKTDGHGAVSPLSIKFGCPSDRAIQWLQKAAMHGLTPHGISFHTGSQQLDPASWRDPIAKAADIFRTLASVAGINTMEVLDVGGGFPVDYRKSVTSIAKFGEAINTFVAEYFSEMSSLLPLVYTEPGRFLPGDAGFIISEVVLISPSATNPDTRWVYLDIGKYGGLVESDIDYPTCHPGWTDL